VTIKVELSKVNMSRNCYDKIQLTLHNRSHSFYTLQQNTLIDFSHEMSTDNINTYQMNTSKLKNTIENIILESGVPVVDNTVNNTFIRCINMQLTSRRFKSIILYPPSVTLRNGTCIDVYAIISTLILSYCTRGSS
jgi:hypothetical protein